MSRLSSALPSRPALAALALTGVLLWLSQIALPLPPAATLDASWQEALVHAHRHGLLFGRDLIFTFGPWGWLTSLFWPAPPLWPKLLWEVLGKAVLCGFPVAFSLRLPGWRRWAFLGALLLFVGIFPDTLSLLFLTLLVLETLAHPGARGGKLAAAAVAMAFLAQVKFTYALLGATGAVAITAGLAVRRRPRAAAAFAAGCLGASLLLWIAAGQELAKLPDYLRYSWSISTGYTSAMAMDGSTAVFLCGAGAIVLAALWVLALLRQRGASATARLTAGFLAAVWFLAWKHGFTRADGHVLGFFNLGLILALALPALYQPPRGRACLAGCALFCVAGLAAHDPGLLRLTPRFLCANIQRNAGALLHPRRFAADWTRGWREAQAGNARPAVRAAVGHGTVDVFGYEQGAALLSGLNYEGRPVFQSYSAYTPALASKNLGFFRGPHAPDFVLFKLQTIDGRFPAQDDALALAELPLRYAFDRTETDGFLVGRKKTPAAASATARDFLDSQDAPLGETVAVPDLRDRAVWMVLHLPLTWLGRLRAFFCRPPSLRLVITNEVGEEHAYRLVTSLAPLGFLLNPCLETQADYAAFAQGRGENWAASIRLEAAPGESEFWGLPSVSFFSIPALPLVAVNPWQSLVRAGATNLAPLSARAFAPVDVFSQNGAAAIFVHAPGELVFKPAAGIRVLRGVFGIRRDAYENGNRTDGVEFTVTAVFAGGRRETLYRRWLDPLSHPRDRGPHPFEVEWRGPAPEHLILQTLPGPNDNNSWDWSYWSGLSFQP